MAGKTNSTFFVHCFGRIVAIRLPITPNSISVLLPLDNSLSLVILSHNSSEELSHSARMAGINGRGAAQSATARAHSNIAFVKYWGNRDDRLRLPANASISMNLADLHTTTTVAWDNALSKRTG